MNSNKMDLDFRACDNWTDGRNTPENIDILFDGNKAPVHPQWRKMLLVHELARQCMVKCRN